MLKDWNELFSKAKLKEYSKTLHAFLDEEYQNKTIYPPRDMVYQAFKFTDPKKLKVIVIGQDPYHNPGQAMGLSFSVPRGFDLPPSLVNIYKEIQKDENIVMNFDNGDLTPWAEQGVLLLNAYLTVVANTPLSHKREEYELFMRDVLDYVETLDQPIVYMLWGGPAQKYEKFITNKNHLIIKRTHPSPLGANHGGWFNENQFNLCNEFLEKHNTKSIDWVKQ